MSGGVDSSVAAALLLRAGHRVVGVTLRYWSEAWAADRKRRAERCCSVGALTDARAVADRLGIPHLVLDCEAEFDRDVIQPFVAAYAAGRTPNPCVACNARLKFAWLPRSAPGAGDLGPGHRALRPGGAGAGPRTPPAAPRRRPAEGSELLPLPAGAAGSSRISPFRSAASPRRRRGAWPRSLGLPVADKPESQEICFVGDDYRPYVRARAGAAVEPGVIRDTAGAVRGRHPGLVHFTVGQRHGLGLSSPQALYVIALDPEQNAVIVGGERDLWTQEVDVERVHLIAGEPRAARCRSSPRFARRTGPAPATITPCGEGRLRLRFEEPERAVAPGQAAVFYDRADPDLLLGGGLILPAAR